MNIPNTKTELETLKAKIESLTTIYNAFYDAILEAEIPDCVLVAFGQFTSQQMQNRLQEFATTEDKIMVEIVKRLDALQEDSLLKDAYFAFKDGKETELQRHILISYLQKKYTEDQVK